MCVYIIMPDKLDSPKKSAKVDFLTKTRFDEFDFHPEIFKGLKTAGFEFCSPIQSQVLPLSLTGRDIAGQAQTGTGKTAAFLLTILARFLKEPPDDSPSTKKYPSALIIAPTRELAIQIHEEAEMLAGDAKLKIVRVIGGLDYDKQAEELRQGVDMVVCTPGRLIDYMKQNIFNPSAIKTVVIDEADRLLDLGFEKDMRFILSKLPHYEKRQSMLFSATLSYRVLELTYQYMNLPEFISVVPDNASIKGIEQSLFHVGNDKKLSLILGILNKEAKGPILIFVNTKAGVEWLAEKLKGNGFLAEGITGDLPQPKRLKLMKRFKEGEINMLVATDVASRGIHVEDISHVINYDLPQEAENYVHRIGRTARAGKTGKAISFACENYVFYLEAIENMIGDKIPVVWAEDDWFADDKAGPVSKRRSSHPRGKRPSDKKPSHKRPPIRKNGKNGGAYGRAGGAKKTSEGKSNPFPGSFFGFGPPSEEDKKADKTCVRTDNKSDEKGAAKKTDQKSSDQKNLDKKSSAKKSVSQKKPDRKNVAKRGDKKEAGKPIDKKEPAKKKVAKKEPVKRVNKKEPDKKIDKKETGKTVDKTAKAVDKKADKKESVKKSDKKDSAPKNSVRKNPVRASNKKRSEKQADKKPVDKKVKEAPEKSDAPLDPEKKPEKISAE